jgi:hypothetical protein
MDLSIRFWGENINTPLVPGQAWAHEGRLYSLGYLIVIVSFDTIIETCACYTPPGYNYPV